MASYFWPPVGGSGVTSLNAETGAVVLVAGAGISITPSGQNITIASSDLAAALLSINADTTAAQTLSVGTAGTDFAIVDAGGGSHVFNLPTASATNRGALSSANWTTFNNKQSTIAFGSLTDAGTDGITITGGTNAVIGTGTSIAQHVADTTHNGYLSSTDWNTFNGKGAGSVTSVSVTTANGVSGSVATATTTPAITLTLGSITPSAVQVSGLTASQAVVTDASKNLASLAYTSLNTGSTIASRDVNGNLAAVNFFITSTSTVTSGQTITLTAGSGGEQIATGTANITYNLPDATTLFLGSEYFFINAGTGSITIHNAGGATVIATILAGGSSSIECTNNGTTNGTWTSSVHLASGATSGTVSTVVPGSMSANTLVSTVATGTAPLTVTSTTQVANLNAATAGNASTVTTNANLTGPITSVGNATSLASTTGSGAIVLASSPTLTGTLTATNIATSGTTTFSALVGPGGVIANASGALAIASIPTIRTYLSAGGPGTYTVPTGATWIRVRVQGGGGGGAAGGSTFNLGGAAGGAGNLSSFTGTGASVSCGGGAGGTDSAVPAVGGTSSGGNIINIVGSYGGGTSNGANAFGQGGASSPLGGAGGGGGNGQNGAAAAANSGSGGGGAGLTGAGVSGGGGAAGGYAEHLITVTPGNTYTWFVGAAGGGGTQTSYASGGAGAVGCILIEEHYSS